MPTDWPAHIIALTNNFNGLVKTFNGFVQKCDRDIAQLKQINAQLIASNNEMDAKVKALEQGCRQLAAMIANGGAGAVRVPGAATVDGQAVAMPAPAVEPVSASGLPIESTKGMSESDQNIFLSGDEG